MSEKWILSSADFDDARVYRYRLMRVWDTSRPTVTFVMLNPSTADEKVLDPTIRRCFGFASEWNFGSLIVCNLFALRSTDPAALYSHADPTGGKRNDLAIENSAHQSALVVAAWGAHGVLQGRSERVAELICKRANLHALKLTKDGLPGHPLYLPKYTKPVLWRPRQEAA